ncbi:peptidoglycan editing factor PgeF [Clostridium sp. MSJ-4]|uniref:Purine nucleoside phosphorylase n=1 Tax=Clostridium simiarum TaxID=2841506 RepID=A0ABS6EYU5_9CLOT|nr:peptidoglycan editing factor PgeF [Clostridium simiarum]
MNSVIINKKFQFIHKKIGNAKFYFSTAYNGISFKKDEEEGLQNIYELKRLFGLKEVGFLNQTHSDVIINYNNVNNQDGDALICKEKKLAIGVFTADCAPILIFDKGTNGFAAVHSGWRGTVDLILLKTLNTMKKVYGSKGEDIVALIGPHNKVCCYEVGEEVRNAFKEKDFYKDKKIFNQNNLDIERCLKYQLRDFGVLEENIFTDNLCTYCEKPYKFHSYRKQKNNSGRSFSFIFCD